VNFKSLNVDFDKDVIIAGDLHGVWRDINFLAARHKPSIILQVGDFGWWPKFDNTTKISTNVWRRSPGQDILAPKTQTKWKQQSVRIGSSRLYFCPGNHEDWVDLESKATSWNPYPVELYKNVFYMPRCSTLDLPDGRRVLFMGGASSIDKAERTAWYDWFPQEVITIEDIDHLPDTKIDIVVSHTCPIEFREQLNEDSSDWRVRDAYWLEKFRDSSCHYLSRVLEKYNPAWWFFGHYHISRFGKAYNTRWICLNKTSETGWWTFLPKENK
jgi:hypothetical protein